MELYLRCPPRQLDDQAVDRLIADGVGVDLDLLGLWLLGTRNIDIERRFALTSPPPGGEKESPKMSSATSFDNLPPELQNLVRTIIGEETKPKYIKLLVLLHQLRDALPAGDPVRAILEKASHDVTAVIASG